MSRGLALHEPSPHATPIDYVRLGDVGFVHNGQFTRTFNLFRDSNHPINQGCTHNDKYEIVPKSFSKSIPSESKESGEMDWGLLKDRVNFIRYRSNVRHGPVSEKKFLSKACVDRTAGAGVEAPYALFLYSFSIHH